MQIIEAIDLKDKQAIRAAFKTTLSTSSDRDILEQRKKDLLTRAKVSKQIGLMLIIAGVPLILAAGVGFIFIAVGIYMRKSSRKQTQNVEETWAEMKLNSIGA
jgi:flagellar biosynthesis component FlhA